MVYGLSVDISLSGLIHYDMEGSLIPNVILPFWLLWLTESLTSFFIEYCSGDRRKTPDSLFPLFNLQTVSGF